MKMNNKIKPLKDLCDNFKQDIVDGPFGSNLKRDDYRIEGIPVLKIQNIKPFKVEIKKMDYVGESKYLELKRHSYKKGDIIMTKLGDPLGASAIVNNIEDGLIVADLVRIRASKIDTRYLCYQLNSPYISGFINSQQKGTTRPRVKISDVRDLPIYSPPLSEQKRIVALIDEAFEAIDKAKMNVDKNLKSARELFESYLQSVFANPDQDCEKKKLGDVIKLEYGKPLPKDKRKLDGAYPVYGANGEIDRTDEYYYGKNSIIVGRKGSAGELNITEEKFWPLDVTYYVTFDSKKYNLFFIYYLLGSLKLPKLAKGVKPGINRNEVYSLDVGIPPLSEQQRIVAKLKALSDETKKLEKIYEQKLANLEELKKSILQKSFNGEL